MQLIIGMAEFSKLRVWRKAHALALNLHRVHAIHSSNELEYHLTIARDLHAISGGDAKSLMDHLADVRKMLYGLIRVCRKSPLPDSAA
jgi:23S rRNA-intervening sequence protein